jgi:hypothetical protein
MKQAGRDSAASKEVVARLPGRFLPPSDGLTVEEQELWARTVATKPIEWFKPDTAELLKSYVRVCTEEGRVMALVNSAHADITDEASLKRYIELVKLHDKVHMRKKDLMTGLRITPQSNMKAEVSHTANKRGGRGITWGPRVVENDEG